MTRFCQSQGLPDVQERLVNNVILNLKGLVHIPDEVPFFAWIEQIDPLDYKSGEWMVFRNGSVELDAAVANEPTAVASHDSRRFTTTVLPFDFIAGATCPKWERFLLEILPRESEGDRRIERLQEFMGYTFLPTCRFEAMLVMPGGGSNGKSTLLRVFNELLGPAKSPTRRSRR